MSYYTIGEFAKKVGLSINTLRNWDKDGKLKPSYISSGGHRYYSDEQLNRLIGIKLDKQERITIGYARVSSQKQKDDLKRQVENIKMYMLAKGYRFEVIEDIGSGIDYNKKGLNDLINRITNREVDKVVVKYKDRLLRFGFEIIENICKKYGTKIEIIDNKEKTEYQELVEDLVQIITVFSCKLQGKRANKAKKMIKELLEDDNC